MSDRPATLVPQFGREIESIRQIFESNKTCPPITRNQPMVAGAIRWSRSLFARIKKTMKRLQGSNLAEVLTTDDVGREVNAKYLAAAKSMMVYEKALFDSWKENAASIAMTHLKEPILRKETGGKIVVNFHPDLTRLIRETRYLDRLGFQVPDIAINLALQEEKYHSFVSGLNEMLSSYKEVISLSPIEKELLAPRLRELHMVLDMDKRPLNWNSLGISEFIIGCNKAIKEFQSLLNQVHKNSSRIEEVIEKIANAELIEFDPAARRRSGGDGSHVPSSSGGVLDLQEFQELIENRRVQVVDDLIAKYRTISSLLGKVEEVVAGTNTGRSPQMSSYYSYWERLIFEALAAMVTRGVFAMKALISRTASADGKKRSPLFKVTLSLLGPDVLVQPPVNEISKVLQTLTKRIVESTQSFVRWLHGSCIECPPQAIEGSSDGEPYIYSFYSDVEPLVVQSLTQVISGIQKTMTSVHRYIDSWKRHSNLWKMDKKQVIEKFLQKQPVLADFEKRMSMYRKLAEDMWNQREDIDLDFVRWVAGAGRPPLPAPALGPLHKFASLHLF